jgi:uncharacterized heparinase superfamily protein
MLDFACSVIDRDKHAWGRYHIHVTIVIYNRSHRGLYYKHDYDHNWWFHKHIMITNDAFRVAQQIVASL